MPRFSTRVRKQPKQPGSNGITDALIRKYEKYVRRIDDDSIGELKFRESEDISRAREALRIAGNKLGRDLIIERPRGVQDVLLFRLREKPRIDPMATVRTRMIATWNLSQAEADRIFGVGMLPQAISELDEATDLLHRYLKADRNTGGCAQPSSSARWNVAVGDTGAGRHGEVADDMSRHVPVRQGTRLTVECNARPFRTPTHGAGSPIRHGTIHSIRVRSASRGSLEPSGRRQMRSWSTRTWRRHA